MHPAAEQVQRQIEEAYALVPYPGDEGIAYSRDAWECPELEADFRGRHWRSVPRETLRARSAYLSLFSTLGLHFYLPAYLLASLEDYDGTLNEDIRPLTIYGLTLSAEDTPLHRRLHESQLKDFAVFTPAQKRAIRAFLEYARDEWTDEFPGGDEPKQALERYWGRDWP